MTSDTDDHDLTPGDADETTGRPTATVRMFSTPWCGYCRRLERALSHHDVHVEVIDIDKEPQHGDVIEELTGGYRTVPTVRVGPDTYLVNPSAAEVLAAIGAA